MKDSIPVPALVYFHDRVYSLKEQLPMSAMLAGDVHVVTEPTLRVDKPGFPFVCSMKGRGLLSELGNGSLCLWCPGL